MTSFAIKRVYEEPAHADEYRILVDRLWPRGLSREQAHIDEWAKEIAPSDALRKWFHHEAGHWEVFRKKYLAELKENPEVSAFLLRHSARRKITLLYGARDIEHNHAVVLAHFLNTRKGDHSNQA